MRYSILCQWYLNFASSGVECSKRLAFFISAKRCLNVHSYMSTFTLIHVFRKRFKFHYISRYLSEFTIQLHIYHLHKAAEHKWLLMLSRALTSLFCLPFTQKNQSLFIHLQCKLPQALSTLILEMARENSVHIPICTDWTTAYSCLQGSSLFLISMDRNEVSCNECGLL